VNELVVVSRSAMRSDLPLVSTESAFLGENSVIRVLGDATVALASVGVSGGVAMSPASDVPWMVQSDSLRATLPDSPGVTPMNTPRALPTDFPWESCR